MAKSKDKLYKEYLMVIKIQRINLVLLLKIYYRIQDVLFQHESMF